MWKPRGWKFWCRKGTHGHWQHVFKILPLCFRNGLMLNKKKPAKNLAAHRRRNRLHKKQHYKRTRSWSPRGGLYEPLPLQWARESCKRYISKILPATDAARSCMSLFHCALSDTLKPLFLGTFREMHGQMLPGRFPLCV